MHTFVIYNFIIIWSACFGLMYERSQDKYQQKFYWLLSFSIPLFFLAIRYDIGTDYQSYVSLFHRIANGEIILKEPAYIFINKSIAYLGLDVQWLFVVFGLLFMFFSYKALPKKGFAIGVFIFISQLYLYEGFSMLRQGVAVAIMSYGIKYIVDRKFIKYLILSLVAMLFHVGTGFILLLVYPIVIRQYSRWLMLGLLVVTYFVIRETNILFSAIDYFIGFFPQYAWYVNSQFFVVANISSGLGVMAKLLIGVLVILFKDSICQKFKNANVIMNLYFMYLFFIILHMKVAIIGRFEHMFIYAQVLALVYFVLSIDKKSRIFVILFVCAWFFMLFNKYISEGTLSIDNDIYINPYQTIFSR